MKRTKIGAFTLIVLALTILSVEAAIRINGNQLLESAATHEVSTTGAMTPVPAKLISNLGQVMLSRSRLPGSATNSGVAHSIGTGLSFDVANVAFSTFTCPVVQTGDVNLSGAITSADIIYLVGYVFKSGSAPMPCVASGDVNCSATVTSADIIYLVGYVFKSGALPCDVCALIPGAFSCP